MAVTLRQVEAVPEEYPVLTGALVDRPENESRDPSDEDWLWQRIESYVAHRWTPRVVVWTVEGEGEWTPPLCPVVSLTGEKWVGGAWVPVTVPVGPFGYNLPGDGPYRMTATVGGGDVPAAVRMAARRLGNYLSVRINVGNPQLWATKSKGESVNVIDATGEGHLSEDSWERPATWMSDAMRKSGAADLLRNYRRAY